MFNCSDRDGKKIKARHRGWVSRETRGRSLLHARCLADVGARLSSLALLFGVSLLCSPLGFSLGASAHEHGTNSLKTGIADDVFAGTNVLRIRIDISRAGMDALRGSGWGNGQRRPTVKATVREGGQVYTNVEVHLKGAAGSFRSVDDNPGLTLNFDKSAPGQNFHGLHKISLNNSVQDRSFLTEKICRELFEASGVPVPRAGHAKVTLNDRDLGLHVLVEGYNKQFLKRYFVNAKGNLYDGGFTKDITDPLEVNSGDDPGNNTALRALIRAAREPDLSKRFARLEQTLDVDRFLSFIAMDVIQCDWDGYAMAHNNWRIYHDLDSNKMVFFPHGLDQMFGVERTTPDCPILPHMQGMVARALIETPEGRKRYLGRITELYTNVFHVEAVLKRVDELAAVIKPALAETSFLAARRNEEEVQRLKRRIAKRDESLSGQLLVVVQQPEFDTNGVMKLGQWRRRTRAGTPQFREETDSNGRQVLYLSAGNGNTVASWRTKVQLNPGNYRFEGHVRTKGVRLTSEEGVGGVGLRISGATVAKDLSGSNEWRRFAYWFQVPAEGKEVELVCELRAASGEAWFDAGTLKLVRQPAGSAGVSRSGEKADL